MRKCIAVLAVLLMLCLNKAYAQTVDLWSDFPDKQGDNDLYAMSFNKNEATSPTAKPYHLLSELDGIYWGGFTFDKYTFGTLNETDYYIPFIKKSNSDSAQFPWGQGIYMHPAVPQGANGSGSNSSIENAVLVYSIPVNGLYDVAGTFSLGDSGNKAVYLKLDNQTVWQTTLNATNQQASFNFTNCNMTTEQHIYFGVGPGLGVPDDRADTTILNGNIRLTPEPVSSTLFLLGAGALGARIFRRKKI